MFQFKRREELDFGYEIFIAAVSILSVFNMVLIYIPGVDPDAINVVRNRAGMPPVTEDATGYNSFMELVWNERAVELCFEGHYWFDIRRWYIAHLPEHKQIIDLNFDYDWTSFSRSLYITKVFEDPKHYWLPLPKDIVFLYKEMYQNAGWQ